jgi:hypothetical protein
MASSDMLPPSLEFRSRNTLPSYLLFLQYQIIVDQSWSIHINYSDSFQRFSNLQQYSALQPCATILPNSIESILFSNKFTNIYISRIFSHLQIQLTFSFHIRRHRISSTTSHLRNVLYCTCLLDQY